MAYYFAIGDVHGCYNELATLIAKLQEKYDLQNQNNRLVFLGDYIDRGDSSVAVLNYLVNLKKQFNQTIFLKGNHEQMLLMNGPSNYCDLPQTLNPEWHEFLGNLPCWCETDHYLFMHGGPETPDVDLDPMDEEYYLWNYHPSSLGWRGKWLVKGHTVVPDARLHNKTLFLDTGCCFGNKLSCAVLEGSDQKIVEILESPRIKP